jgi:hypothetical protein
MYLIVYPGEVVDRLPEPITPHGNAKTLLNSIFVLSIFGQFDYKLETNLLKSENRFHAQHLLPCAVDKLTDDHVATIYEAYQADIYICVFVIRGFQERSSQMANPLGHY